MDDLVQQNFRKCRDKPGWRQSLAQECLLRACCVSVGTRGSTRNRARLCGGGSMLSTPSSADNDNIAAQWGWRQPWRPQYRGRHRGPQRRGRGQTGRAAGRRVSAVPFSLAEDAREWPWGPGPGPAPVPVAPALPLCTRPRPCPVPAALVPFCVFLVPGSGWLCGACDGLCDTWGMSGTFQ